MRPDRWDFAGAVLCIAGAAVIIFAPREPSAYDPKRTLHAVR